MDDQSSGQKDDDPIPELAIFWHSDADPAASATPTRTTRRAGSRRLLLSGLVALVLAVAIGVAVALSTASGGSGQTGGAVSTTPASSSPGSTASDSSLDPPPSDDTSASPLTETAAAPTTPSSPRDPPGPGVGARLVSTSSGAACQAPKDEYSFAGYPAARCRFWQRPRGLHSGERADEGRQEFACQRDLDLDNPVFSKEQTNTWWVWTTSSAGTWDWFPETAVVEGAPDEPINGIAICR